MGCCYTYSTMRLQGGGPAVKKTGELPFSRDDVLKRLLRVYVSSYDITKREYEDDPLVVTADFHEHQSGFILIRKAEMWSADRHEFSYIYSMPHLTKALFEECVARTRELGEPRIDHSFGHMCTNLVSLFLVDEIDEDALAALKKYRFRKSFRFTINGWTEAHTAVVSVKDGVIAANGAGRDYVNFFQLLLGLKKPKKRKRPLILSSLGE